MNRNVSYTCVLVGGQSLLIECGERLIKAGHKISTVISDDPAVAAWAKGQEIQLFAFDQNNLHKVAQDQFDYLFSIANLKILPEALIRAAKKLAINFHDGRLPDYAGLNTPTWAILNREKEFAINWHVMTDEVDKGDVLESLPVTIDDNDTSLSVNIKCFEVGIQAFEKLLRDIELGSLQPIRQDLAGYQFYAKCQRPQAASTIDWNCAAEDIDALIRGLNFGSYWNPLGMPKLYLGKVIALVDRLELTDRTSTQTPGTILSVHDDLEVSTKTFDVIVRNLRTLDGQPIAARDMITQAGLQQNVTLPALSAEQTDRLTELDSKACLVEQSWVEILKNIENLELPYSKNKGNIPVSRPDKQLAYAPGAGSTQTIEGLNAETLAMTVMLYFALLGQKDRYSLVFNRTGSDAGEQDDIYFEQRLPFNVQLDYQDDVATTFARLQSQFAGHTRKAGYPRDLVFRDPVLAQHYPEYSSEALALSVLLTEGPVTPPRWLSGELAVLIPEHGSETVWCYDDRILSEEHVKRMQSQFGLLLEQVRSKPDARLTELSIATDEDLSALQGWNDTDQPYEDNICIHQLFERQVSANPDAIALSCQGKDLSYGELNRRANQIAHILLGKGIQPDDLVGILIDRSSDMITAMLGVLKAGAAYLPLDPAYPVERIRYMLEDGEVPALLTLQKHADDLGGIADIIALDSLHAEIQSRPGHNPQTSVTSHNLAYTIYTSGSTGKPKGVMVEHRNVVNFFSGMDQRIWDGQPGTWLAVTSISFDISVLEIFWTLARGFQVVLFVDELRQAQRESVAAQSDEDMKFSLFYWNVAEDESEYDEDKYRLLIESAKFADQHHFAAVWTPERHFHAFGGLYPNPSVTSAALATITKNIAIRAGSCVLPLHHPIRVVEEWSMVDNFSNGRVGLAMAAGWQPNDFVIMPQNHARAKQIMFESIELVKRLWRGETVQFPGPGDKPVDVRTLPRPIQKELPIWITTAGNPETFRQAGEIGANVLTHLLGQSVDDVAKNIAIYRDAYRKAGHAGKGEVTLLLHTLVGPDGDKIKEIARQPMKNYLKSAMFLVKAAAWHFPTFKNKAGDDAKEMDEYFANLSEQDMDELLDFAFERYYGTSGLFGTPQSCLAMVDKLKEIGVTEIGCLIDYGIETETLLSHLPYLNELRKLSNPESTRTKQHENQYSIPDLIERYGVTHFQCTPSMADMLLSDMDAAKSLGRLNYMMVGGEAFPPSLAEKLRALVSGKIINMYGPTETTIWSSTHEVKEDAGSIPIGTAITNTQLYIMDKHLNPLPVGVAGELMIGGAGVVRGYYKRPELTAERFVVGDKSIAKNKRIYRTGDLAKFNSDGVLEYLGRIDQQVKIRGYRIELGEIESALRAMDGIQVAAVVARDDAFGIKQLVAYIVPKAGFEPQQTAMQKHLRQQLPEFMVPGVFINMDALPLTPNGKIDRKALPDPKDTQAPTRAVRQAKPDTPAVEAQQVNVQMSAEKQSMPDMDAAEQMLRDIWGRLLGLPTIDRNDNFFDIGGHSILAVKMQGELKRALGKRLPITDIFRYPTIAELARRVNEIPN